MFAIFIILILAIFVIAIQDKSDEKINYNGLDWEELFATEVDCAKVAVRESVHGLGCFALSDFREGDVIERGVMMPLPGVDGNNHEHLFTWSDDRLLFASGSGCLPFYNHSQTPNVKKVGDLKANRMKIVALRDIKLGEELRNRYMSAPWRTCFKNLD